MSNENKTLCQEVAMVALGTTALKMFINGFPGIDMEASKVAIAVNGKEVKEFTLNELIESVDSFMRKVNTGEYLVVKPKSFFSHDMDSGLIYHSSQEEAEKAASEDLEIWRERLADGMNVVDEGGFSELCHGVVIESAEHTLLEVVSQEHHDNDEYKRFEVGTEILHLSLVGQGVDHEPG